MQTGATLLANNSQNCWMLHVASVYTPCCMLLGVVAQSLKLVKILSQQLLTFCLFRDFQSIAQKCWICLHSSSKVVGANQGITHGLQSLMSCILPTMHCKSQHCWELLCPFAHSFTEMPQIIKTVLLVNRIIQVVLKGRRMHIAKAPMHFHQKKN